MITLTVEDRFVPAVVARLVNASVRFRVEPIFDKHGAATDYVTIEAECRLDVIEVSWSRMLVEFEPLELPTVVRVH